MNTAALNSIVSEFETAEQAASYDLWFRDKVQAAMVSTESRLAHDQVMGEMRVLIEAKRKTAVHAG